MPGKLKFWNKYEKVSINIFEIGVIWHCLEFLVKIWAIIFCNYIFEDRDRVRKLFQNDISIQEVSN